jgi:hypothetical protein
VRLVATPETVDHVIGHGGAVYVWPKAMRCCGGRTFTLEASTEQPDRVFEQIHAEQGVEVWATPGLISPTELELQVGRRGALRAFWNCQNWIG